MENFWIYLIVFVIGAVMGTIFGMLFGRANKKKADALAAELTKLKNDAQKAYESRRK